MKPTLKIIRGNSNFVVVNENNEEKKEKEKEELASWCFESIQPERITTGLKTNFNLSSNFPLHVIIR